MKPSELTLVELKQRFDAGELSVREALTDTLDAIDEQQQLNAYIHVPERESLLERADAVDQKRADGQDLPSLAGIPIALKDNICKKGWPTTAGSKILDGFVAPYDATVARKLEEQGAIVLGKTNLDEFAMGSSNETSFFGAVLNPHDEKRTPGGSSGGSAAAVAANLCSAALGSDTGGSIRQPASHCGVVGLKPTYGRVSRYGLIAFASSLDQIGPMTRSVTDAAVLLGALAGHDPKDATSTDLDVPNYMTSLDDGVEGLTVGLPKEYFQAAGGIDDAVAQNVKDAVAELESRGAEVVDISLPHTEYAVSTYYLIATAEASSNLARYDGARYGHRAEDAASLEQMYERTRAEGFGAEVKRRIMLGTYVLSAGYYDKYYRRAQKVRTLIRRDFDEAFEDVDVILTPTAPTPAFELGAKTDDPLQMYLEDIFTISCNLAGIPGMSVPCGTDGDGLPIGLQLLAPAYREDLLFRVGAEWERSRQ
jgi:aspartyl-tRNA(Asn)/glutamyl-tRNA(Gln) amidotransferase subunit A